MSFKLLERENLSAHQRRHSRQTHHRAKLHHHQQNQRQIPVIADNSANEVEIRGRCIGGILKWCPVRRREENETEYTYNDDKRNGKSNEFKNFNFVNGMLVERLTQSNGA